MAGLAELYELAQQNTATMVFLLWLSAGAGYRLLSNQAKDNGEAIEDLEAVQSDIQKEVRLIDQKQDHILDTQESILERVADSEQELQDLREDHARIDAAGDLDLNASSAEAQKD